MPKVMAVGGGAFENCLAHEGGASQMGWYPMEETPSAPQSPPAGEVSEEQSCRNQGRLPDTKSAKTCEEQMTIVYKPPRGCYFVTIAWTDS